MIELRSCITCSGLGRHSKVAIATAVCTLRTQMLFAWGRRTRLVANSRLAARPRLQIRGMVACDCDSVELATAVAAIECP